MSTAEVVGAVSSVIAIVGTVVGASWMLSSKMATMAAELHALKDDVFYLRDYVLSKPRRKSK